MRKVHIKKSIKEYILRNKWQFLLVLLCAAAGTVLGSFYGISLDGETNSATVNYIKNFVSALNFQIVDQMEIYKFSFYNNTKLILFLWLSGFWVGFILMSVIYPGLKAFKLGFSGAIFVKIFGIKGAVLSVIFSLPQVLMIVSTILYAVFNINFALLLFRKRETKNIQNKLYIKNLLGLLLMFAVALLVGLIDAYIMPPVLKLICPFLNA